MDDEMRSLLESIPDGGPISIDQLATAAAKQGRRRRLLRVVPAVVAVAALTVAAAIVTAPAAHADTKYEMKIATVAPDNTAWATVLKEYKKNVEKASGGRIKIRIFLGGMLTDDENNSVRMLVRGQVEAIGASTGSVATIVKELEAIGNIHIFMVDDGWAWLIPQPGGRVSVGRVSARRGVRASDLDEAIGASPRIRRATEAAERLQSHLCGNYSYRNRSPYGVRHACVGDAAGFLDPCFSSGVAFAMLGAEWLVDALVPALAAGAEADPDLAAGASRAMDRGYRTMGALIERFYHAGLVDRLFFYDTPTPELRQGLISLLAGDLWRDDNPFERLLVSSRRRSGKGHDPRRPERA